MKKMVMTQEIIDDFKQRHMHRPDKWQTAFSCKLCRPLWRASKVGLAEYWEERLKPTLRAGQEVYVVTYPNGTVGYYHVLCVDRLKELREKQVDNSFGFLFEIEEILRYDIDKWRGVQDFIKPLVQKEHSKQHIIAEIMTRFNCSHTTAWRKLRAFNKNLP